MHAHRNFSFLMAILVTYEFDLSPEIPSDAWSFDPWYGQFSPRRSRIHASWSRPIPNQFVLHSVEKNIMLICIAVCSVFQFFCIYIYIYTHRKRFEIGVNWRIGIQESKDCNEFPKSNYPLMSSSNDRSVTKVRLNWSLIWRALKYFGCWLYEIRLHLTRRNAVSRLIVNRSVNQTTN